MEAIEGFHAEESIVLMGAVRDNTRGDVAQAVNELSLNLLPLTPGNWRGCASTQAFRRCKQVIENSWDGMYQEQMRREALAGYALRTSAR